MGERLSLPITMAGGGLQAAILNGDPLVPVSAARQVVDHRHGQLPGVPVESALRRDPCDGVQYPALTREPVERLTRVVDVLGKRAGPWFRELYDVAMGIEQVVRDVRRLQVVAK